MRSGVVYPRPTFAVPTAANVSGAWLSPTTSEGNGVREADGKRSVGLNTQAERGWQTPGTDSFRSRGGDRRDEMGLDQQARKLWRTPDAPSGGGSRTHTTSRGEGHQVTIAEQAEEKLWPTPNARDYKGATSEEALMRPNGRLRLDQLDRVAEHGKWPTPRAEDSEQTGAHRGVEDTLTSKTRNWPTPATTDASSSARHTTTTGVMNPGTSLTDAIRSFPLDRKTTTHGESSSPSDPSSHQQSLWKTPHGMGNTDASGKTAGGGGEFAKQATEWRSPNTRDHHAQGPREDAQRQTTLVDQIQTRGVGPKKKLNPLFVEWLMGWPLGWTDSALAETEWFLWRRRMRSFLLRLVSET